MYKVGRLRFAVAILCLARLLMAAQTVVAVSGVKNDIQRPSAIHDTTAYYYEAIKIQSKALLDSLGWQWALLDPTNEARVANSVRNECARAEKVNPDSLSTSCAQVLREQGILYAVVLHGYTEEKDRGKGEEGASIPSPVRGFFPTGSGADFNDPGYNPDTVRSYSQATPRAEVRVTLACTIFDVVSNHAIYQSEEVATQVPIWSSKYGVYNAFLAALKDCVWKHYKSLSKKTKRTGGLSGISRSR